MICEHAGVAREVQQLKGHLQHYYIIRVCVGVYSLLSGRIFIIVSKRFTYLT